MNDVRERAYRKPVSGDPDISSESEFDTSDPYCAIKQIFNCFDTDGDGYIDR